MNLPNVQMFIIRYVRPANGCGLLALFISVAALLWHGFE